MTLELKRKTMFLKNGLIAPAAWSIKFHDQRRTLLHPNLIHTVFIAVKRQQPAIAVQTQHLQCVQDDAGLEAGK